jgi:cyclic pyranopterin phosphate synthase
VTITAPGATTLRDQFGRSIEYLRISVTDRCNFRCVYCMPETGMQWLPKSEILSYEEIAEVVGQLAPLGLRRIRITGGEPTIRPQIHELIRMVRAVPEITDIALSTNGVRLPEIGALLRESGLNRVNMSVDSLRDDRIVKIARRSLGFDPVRSALAAEQAGLDPIKLNMVVMRGINDDEVEDLARLTLTHPWHVRFIELMPVGDMRTLTWEHVVPSDEILARLNAIAPLSPSSGPAMGNGPGRILSVAGRLPERIGRHHADDAHVLRVVQSRPAHGRRPAPHVSVRRSRSGFANAAESRHPARVVLSGSARE